MPTNFREAMLKETEGRGNKTPAKPKGHDASAKTQSNAKAVPAKDTAGPATPGKPPKGTQKVSLKQSLRLKLKAELRVKEMAIIKAKVKARVIQRVPRRRRIQALRRKLP